ncbi:hypothetical protein Hdeb2414_s0026g00676291 [Helianthus debilis subsp. tardiflorus]
MKPIKCNCFPNHSPPLDLAEMKSQPLKLKKITSPMAVQNSSSQFLQQVVTTIFFYPLSPQFKLVVLLNSSKTQAYNPPGKPPIQLPTLP